MRIVLEYRNPTSTHCTVAVFINGALSGELTLRQDEVFGFDHIIRHGAKAGLDTVLSRGASQLVMNVPEIGQIRASEYAAAIAALEAKMRSRK